MNNTKLIFSWNPTSTSEYKLWFESITYEKNRISIYFKASDLELQREYEWQFFIPLDLLTGFIDDHKARIVK